MNHKSSLKKVSPPNKTTPSNITEANTKCNINAQSDQRIWPDDYDKCIEMSQGGIMREHNFMLDENIGLRQENTMLKKTNRLLRKEVMYLKGHLEIIRSYSDPPTIDQLINWPLSDEEINDKNECVRKKS